MNLHRFKRHKHQIVRRALDQAMFFELAGVGMHIGIVARNIFRQCVDRAGAALPQGFQQVYACEGQFCKKRLG